MRRLIRLGRSIDLLETFHSPRTVSRSAFVCRSCRTRLSSTAQRAAISTSTRRARNGDNSSEKVPFTEKVRRRIWGTESPPGQADPYGDVSLFDQTKKNAGKKIEPDEAPEEVAGVVPDDSGYVPATTWDGLEQVGGFGGWWKDNWDEEHAFRGFLPPKKLLSKQDLTLALHRAVVEVFTLREAGRPMTDATNAKDDRIIPNTSQVGILLSGQELVVALSYPDEQTKEAILQSTVLSKPVEEVTNVQAEVEEARAGMEKDTAGQSSLQDVESTPVEEIMQQNTNPSLSAPKQATLPSDSTWLNISLLDPAVKFAIIKRTMQLTGTHVPDPTIHQIQTVQHLLSHLAQPPKPKKLAEVLAKDTRLTGLPNVRVLDRRVTPIDKEKEVGRWKVIERELARRGLPVTGNA